MATNYDFDRKFTDYVHKNLALKLIYESLNWVEKKVDENLLTQVDMKNAIDYFFIDKNNENVITVQERFRESKYRNYNDFTIRFEREYNPHEDRKHSEYYKLDSDYFVYGIINAAKVNVEKATDFIKYAVIDIKKFKQLLDTETIIVDRNMRSKYCEMRGEKMYCPVNQNVDFSSSFVPVDIPMLYKLCPESIVVIKGFN